jgi:hypothetical protein
VVFIDREPSRPTTVRARGYVNPYARVAISPAGLGIPCLAPPDGTPRPRSTDDIVPLCWHEPLPAEVEL